MGEERCAYITGASGFVGSHLAERLVKEGYAVRALVYEKEGRNELLERLGVECFPGDITGPPEKLKEGLRGATHVFHLAAQVDAWAARERMVNVNVKGLGNLLHAMRDMKVRRFVFLSSMMVYGTGDLVRANESSPFVETGDNYNHSKIQCERMLWEHVRETGLPAVALRPPYIYGERDNKFIPRLCESLLNGRWTYLSGGRIPFNLVSVGNVAEACVLAATREEAVGEGFLITDGETISRRELVELVCDEMGYDRQRPSAPRWWGKMMCPLFELTARVVGGQRPPRLNRFIYQFMGSHMDFDISKARRLLRYEPKGSTRDSLRQTLIWFRKNFPELLVSPENSIRR